MLECAWCWSDVVRGLVRARDVLSPLASTEERRRYRRHRAHWFCEDACVGFGQPGHTFHPTQINFIGRTPKAWREVRLHRVRRGWATLHYADPLVSAEWVGRPFGVRHHRDLSGLTQVGAVLRIHEPGGALEVGAKWISVQLAGGRGGPAEGEDPEHRPDLVTPWTDLKALDFGCITVPLAIRDVQATKNAGEWDRPL